MSGGSQRAGIAMSQDRNRRLRRSTCDLSQPLRAMVADGQVGLEVLLKDGLGCLDEGLNCALPVRDVGLPYPGLEVVHGISKINSGWAAAFEVVQRLIDVTSDVAFGDLLRVVVQLGGKTEGGDDGDGGGTTDAHGLDRIKSFSPVGHLIVVKIVRETQLIEDLERSSGVLDSLESRHGESVLVAFAERAKQKKNEPRRGLEHYNV